MPERPNVVLLLADQLRRQALGHAGDPNVETPAIDAMAAEGTRFENACCTYPVCVPARFTLVTGEYAHTRGVPTIDYRLSPAERTLGDAFSAAGYHTGYVGKWHLSGHNAFRGADLGSTDRGRYLNRSPVPTSHTDRFDHWRGFELRNEPFDTAYFAGDDPEPRQLEGYQTDGLFDLGIEYLDERDADEPFFLTVSVEPPHPPLSAPDAYYDRVRDRTLEFRPNVPYGDPENVPVGHSEWGSREHASEAFVERPSGLREDACDDIRGYYAMIENLDDNVARFRAALEERGLAEDTVVVLLSDHGEHLGSHGRWGKRDPHEESIGVPFVVSGPGIESRSVAAPTCSEDWFPTLCGLAGIDVDAPGADLSTVARGGSPPDRPGVLLQYVREDRATKYSDETWRGFRTERYKYTVKGNVEGGRPWQLFDLEADPYEQTNLVDDPDHERVARRLHGHLREALVRTDDPYPLADAFGHDPLNVAD